MKVMMRMDRLRRSLRDSFRRRKSSSSSGRSSSHTGTGGPSGDLDRDVAAKWAEDERDVRRGSCSFFVKYYGCIEVFESRGMQVCEEALKMLRASKRRPVRGKLLINGDGVRIVDDETRGLVLDILIEKISFCSPDRNQDRGFAWISRDGTTRRWICHGVMATHDSGERLSHAMGCAFGICLERKQARERDQALHQQQQHLNNLNGKTSTAQNGGHQVTVNGHHHHHSHQSRAAAVHNGLSRSSTTSGGSQSESGSQSANGHHPPGGGGSDRQFQRSSSRSQSVRGGRIDMNSLAGNLPAGGGGGGGHKSAASPPSPPPVRTPPPNPYAIERRHAPASFMARAGSLRVKSDALPFKRQYSLRVESASTAARRLRQAQQQNKESEQQQIQPELLIPSPIPPPPPPPRPPLPPPFSDPLEPLRGQTTLPITGDLAAAATATTTTMNLTGSVGSGGYASGTGTGSSGPGSADDGTTESTPPPPPPLPTSLLPNDNNNTDQSICGRGGRGREDDDHQPHDSDHEAADDRLSATILALNPNNPFLRPLTTDADEDEEGKSTSWVSFD